MPSFLLFGINTLISALAFGLVELKPVLAFTQCYYPDGSIPTDYVWEPCTGSEFSSCCIPSEGDICQEDGLCYYPLNEQVYRGTCTDRTWNDPSCPSNICVNSFETTWVWVSQCGASDFECGPVESDFHTTASCPADATSSTAWITTTSSSSAGRYTPPPSLDTNLYSLLTSSYTTIITANVQTTTLTSTFESTFTSTLSPSSSSGTGTAVGVGAGATNTGSAKNTGGGKVTLSTGALVAIIAGPVVAILLAIGLFFFIRHKRAAKKPSEAIRLNSTEHPPPNGPIGADQTHPYEVPVNEFKGAYAPSVQKQDYGYQAVPAPSPSPSPRPDAYEMGGGGFGGMGEKKWGASGAQELGVNNGHGQGYAHGGIMSPASPASPAPMYTENVIPVELDGTSSFRGRPGGL